MVCVVYQAADMRWGVSDSFGGNVGFVGGDGDGDGDLRLLSEVFLRADEELAVEER